MTYDRRVTYDLHSSGPSINRDGEREGRGEGEGGGGGGGGVGWVRGGGVGGRGGERGGGGGGQYSRSDIHRNSHRNAGLECIL